MANFCENCGAKLTGATTFCTQCGARIKTPAAQPRQVVQTPRPAQSDRPTYPQQQQQRQQQPYTKPVQAQPQRTYGQPARPAQPVQPPQPARPQQQPYGQPRQAVQPKQPVKAKQAKNNGRKRSRVALAVIIPVAVILVAVFIVTAFFAPGFLVKTKKSQDTVISDSKNAVAMLEYARQLEEDGNYDAAAQIYSMLPDSVIKGAEEEAYKVVDDSPEKRIIDGVDEARDILNDVDELLED